MIYEIEMMGWRLWMFFDNLHWHDWCCLFPLILYIIAIVLCGAIEMVTDSIHDEEEDYVEEDDWDENVETIRREWRRSAE